MKMSQRSFLMLGLLTAVSFNLGWNPEHFFISRHEIQNYGVLQEMQLAQLSGTGTSTETRSETAAPGQVQKIHLGDYDKKGQGVDLHFTVIDNNKVRYYYTGKDGQVIQGLSSVNTLSDENINNAEILKRLLAEKGLEDVGRQQVTGSDVARPRAQTPPPQKPPKPPKMTNPCDESTYSAQISCEQGELQNIIGSCGIENIEAEEGSRRRAEKTRGNKEENACIAKANQYFSTFMKKTFKEAFSEKATEDDRQAAIDARDTLLTDLPPLFSRIREDLLSASANLVLAKAKISYMKTLQETNSEGYAVNAAKRAIVDELTKGDGLHLCTVMADTNSNRCQQAFQNSGARMQLESQSPAFKTYVASYQSKLAKIAFEQTQNTSTFINTISGEFSSGELVTNSNITPEFMTARAQGGRQSVSPVAGNGTGQLQLGQGLQAPSGPVSVPSARPGMINPATGNPVLQGQPGYPNNQQPYLNNQQPYINNQPYVNNQQAFMNQPNFVQPSSIQQVIPGQPYNPQAQFSSPTTVYNPMNPVYPGGPNVGVGNQGYPLSPAQAGGRF